MRVGEIMTGAVVTVTPQTGVKAAAALMPLESTPDPRSHILPLPAGRPPVAGAVAEVMTSKVVTLPPDADAAQAAQLMLAHGLRSIPVTVDGRVVGIVTRRDLMRVLARGDEEIRRDLAALLAEELPEEPIGLEVVEGAVTLTFSGTPEPRDRRIAELLASTVPGVLSV